MGSGGNSGVGSLSKSGSPGTGRATGGMGLPSWLPREEGRAPQTLPGAGGRSWEAEAAASGDVGLGGHGWQRRQGWRWLLDRASSFPEAPTAAWPRPPTQGHTHAGQGHAPQRPHWPALEA